MNVIVCRRQVVHLPLQFIFPILGNSHMVVKVSFVLGECHFLLLFKLTIVKVPVFYSQKGCHNFANDFCQV